VFQTSGPGEDGSDRVGGSLFALLVLAVVASHGAVSSFRFNGLAVGTNLKRKIIFESQN